MEKEENVFLYGFCSMFHNSDCGFFGLNILVSVISVVSIVFV